jgi:hypothetical protein
MTISIIDDAQRKAAKVAGISCLFAFAIVVYSNFAIVEPLIVSGDAVATANNIVAHQSMFRIGVACDVIYSATVFVLLSSLYVILKPVNRNLALVAALFRLAYAVMWIDSALNMLGTLRLLGDASYLGVFAPAQLQTLARLQLASNFDAYYVGLPFFALASTICSYLWLKSRYVPKALAGFGLICSGWAVFCAFAFLAFPDFEKSVNAWLFDSPLGIFELVISFWLLFKGLSSPATAELRPVV